jgi:hypothetical protein
VRIALAELIVLEIKPEVMQSQFQLLWRLEVDYHKSQLLGLVDIRQGIVNEDTFPGRSSDFLQDDLIDLRIGLYKANFTGKHDPIEEIKEIIFGPRLRKCLC